MSSPRWPKLYPVQHSFSSGEVSPRLLARSDLEGYSSALSEMTNMRPDAQGPATRRSGYRFVREFPQAVEHVKLMPFYRDELDSPVVAVRQDGTINIIVRGSNTLGNNLLTNANFDTDLTGWDSFKTGAGSTIAHISGGGCRLTTDSTAGALAGIRQQFTVVNDNPLYLLVRPRQSTSEPQRGGTLRFKLNDPGGFSLTVGSLLFTFGFDQAAGFGAISPSTVDGETIEALTGDTGSNLCVLRLSNKLAADTIDLEYDSSSSATLTWNPSESVYEVVDSVLANYLAAELGNSISLVIPEAAAEVFNVVIDQSRDSATLWQPPSKTAFVFELELSGDSKSVDILLTSATEVIEATEDVELTGAPYQGDEVYDIQYAQAPGTLDLYMVHPLYAPYKISYDNLTDQWSFAIVSFSNQPGGWNDTNGWPQCVTFHQQRLWLGPTRQQPETMWASKSADFENFNLGTAQDDDGLEFTLSRRGRIEWMEGGVRNFLIGTSRNEFIVSSDTGTITPSDIQIEPQSVYGSKSIQVEPLGERVLFVSPDGRKIRSMGYRWTEEQWIATDITFPSEHITLPGIKEIHFAQDPDNLVVMPTETGEEVIGCTYERSSDTIGFFRDVTDGRVISSAVTQLSGTSFVWHAVRRWRLEGSSRVEYTLLEYTPGVTFLNTAGSQDLRPLASQSYYESFVNGAAWMDSFIREDGPQRTKVVVGMHLAGREVQVIADGARLLDKTVDSGGEINLEVPATVVFVGLKYKSRMVTMPIEVGAVVSQGSGATLFKRFNKIVLRVADSAVPAVNGEIQPDRTPSTLMDTPEPLFTGFIEVTNFGFDREARVTIETDLPYPLDVLGMYGHFGQDDL